LVLDGLHVLNSLGQIVVAIGQSKILELSLLLLAKKSAKNVLDISSVSGLTVDLDVWASSGGCLCSHVVGLHVDSTIVVDSVSLSVLLISHHLRSTCVHVVKEVV